MPVCIYHFLNLKFCAKIANLPKEKGYFCAKSDKMLKIGVLGTRNFSKGKVDIIHKFDSVKLVGFFSPDKTLHDDEPASGLPLPKFTSLEKFCERTDAIYIDEPDAAYFDLLIQLLKKSKHLFFEKAITFNAQQTSLLLETASEAGVHIQFGHLSQYNPAFMAAMPQVSQPELINTQLLVMPTEESFKTEVINQLIDDLVIALAVVPSEIKKVHATGVSIINKTPDVIHAKVEFINGSVFTLMGSRISSVQHHQTEFFKHEHYIKVDFTGQRATGLLPGMENRETAQLKEFTTKPSNALGSAIENFYNAIAFNKAPGIPVFTSFKAIGLARQILDKVIGSGNANR